MPPVPNPDYKNDATKVRPMPTPTPTPMPMPPTPAAMPPPPDPNRRSQPSGDETIYDPIPTQVTSEILGVLVAIDGELKGQIFKVADGENRIGRATDCAIELPSQKISREHAMLIHQDGMFVIKPLNEKNPTFINEVPTQGDELADGDTLRMGLTTLKFRTI